MFSLVKKIINEANIRWTLRCQHWQKCDHDVPLGAYVAVPTLLFCNWLSRAWLSDKLSCEVSVGVKTSHNDGSSQYTTINKRSQTFSTVKWGSAFAPSTVIATINCYDDDSNVQEDSRLKPISPAVLHSSLEPAELLF